MTDKRGATVVTINVPNLTIHTSLNSRRSRSCGIQLTLGILKLKHEISEMTKELGRDSDAIVNEKMYGR